jgi:hypothetical protein
MSTKFEQLLDLIVNEESEKAQELFHAIVVEKSREIYENLIAEEEEGNEFDEAEETDEDPVEEAEEDPEESVEENMDLEDSYSMEADDEDPMSGSGDSTDDLEQSISAGGDDIDGEEDPEEQEDNAIMDIKTAIQELEAAFAQLEQSQGGENSSMGFGDEEMGKDNMGGSDDMMGKPAFEGRRITREYTEKVGNDWDKSGSQKSQGQYVGSGSGDKEGSPVEGRSPIASGKNKPGPANVNGRNLVQGSTEGQSNTGTSPGKVNNGITKTAGEKFASGIHNVDGMKSGVKTLGKVANGHGAEKKGSGPGPVGSGTGDKAGQTSVTPVKQFLKPAN